tara:strand:- start:717 stop:956 length:240 start_codon:yes stop_codon:yes gene_type:complete
MELNMTENNDKLQDLSNKAARSTIAVIDAMTQRGAFKGEELTTIGTLRDQCVQIVQLCEQIQQDKAMESGPAEIKEEKK